MQGIVVIIIELGIQDIARNHLVVFWIMVGNRLTVDELKQVF